MEPHTLDENYLGDGKESVPMKNMNTDSEKRLSSTRRDSTTEPPRPSYSDIVNNPFDHLTLIVFCLCGLLGLVFAIVALAGSSVGVYVACVLCITGFLAAYQIRMLATLKKELNELEEVQKELEEQVERLDKEVDIYKEKNDEFEVQTEKLKVANEEFSGEIAELEETEGKLKEENDKFTSANKELDNQLEKMASANENLKGSLESLKTQTDTLETQISQFQELQESIGKYAEKNNTDMSEALEKQADMFNKLKGLMSDNAATLLHQVAQDMEYFDDEEGMTEEEFNNWLNRIPGRFRRQLENKGFSFAQFAGENGDNIMDFEEMGKLIDELLKEAKDEEN